MRSACDGCAACPFRRAKGEHAQQNHFQPAALIRRQRQIAAAVERNLVEQLQVFGADLFAQRQQFIARADITVQRLRHGFGHRHVMQQADQIGQHRFEIRRQLRQRLDFVHYLTDIARHQRAQNRQHAVARHRAQHVAHLGFTHCAAAKGNRLIQQAEAVAHAAVGAFGQQLQRGQFVLNAFGLQNVLQLAENVAHCHALQIELQAARQNGHRQFLRVGGSEQELDVRRRLFQRFQQRIETALGKHVHLVDQVHLVTPAGGRVLHVFQQLAGVVHPGARGGVDFNQVDIAALGNFGAGRAFATGCRSDAFFAIQRFGENARDGGFADTAGAGEQIGVVQPVFVQRIDQRALHVLLTNQLGKIGGTPLARQNLVTHRVILQWQGASGEGQGVGGHGLCVVSRWSPHACSWFLVSGFWFLVSGFWFLAPSP